MRGVSSCAKPVYRCCHQLGAEEGVWAWTDGEPLSFTNWKDNQPNNADDGPGSCTDGQDFVVYHETIKWVPDETDMGQRPDGVAGKEKVPASPGCFVNCGPFVCSKPAAPATAKGGRMHGCLNGHSAHQPRPAADHRKQPTFRLHCLKFLNTDKYCHSTNETQRWLG